MPTKHSIALTAIAAALALPVAMESAHAAVVGSFDPAFGPSIPNLGFMGQITMELSAGCNGLTGYHSLDPVGYGFGNCEIKATSAYIDFYNSKSDPSPSDLDPPTRTPLNRQNLTFADFGNYYIYAADFDANGMLDGIDTQYSSDFQIAVTDTSDLAYLLHYNDGQTGFTDSMNLFFTSGHNFGARAAFQSSAVQSTGSGFLNNNNDSGTTPSGAAGTTFFTVPDAVVPEPDSIALTGLGLAALIASRRRAKGAR